MFLSWKARMSTEVIAEGRLERPKYAIQNSFYKRTIEQTLHDDSL